MVLSYGITTLVCLCMVGLCVLADKKRDIWLLLVFLSVSVCNLGYFMLSISKDLGDALNSNRLAYLGSVFLPFFMLMMILRFCGIRRRKTLTVVLVTVGIVMLGITTSPGVLPIYYRTVNIEIVDGVTKLVREYGPLHLLYYVYLFGYMISMVVVTFFAIGKKMIHSTLHTVLLLCAVFCNIIIWLVEQFLPRGFELLSVSYIITEYLILAIYRSMQKQGLLNRNERTQSYTINLLLSVFLLLFANLICVVAKNATPAMYVISQVVVLLIYAGLLLAWGLSVYDRVMNKSLRRYMISLVGLMMLWMLLHTLRHTVFLHIFPLGQWCWYAYYIPMIFIPQLSVFATKCLSRPENDRLSKGWYILYIPSILLICGILSNDLHQGAFRFYLGYEQGWDIYAHGPLYYAAVVWIFGCIAMTIMEMIKHCRIPAARKTIWPPILLLGMGTVYAILYAVNSHLFGFIEMSVALCVTVVSIWESSIKTGLIQSNSHYEELLKSSGLGITLVDEEYRIHYRSEDAIPIPTQQIKAIRDNPQMVDGGIRLMGAKIRGGFTMWQEDVSEITDVLEELKTLQEELRDSNALSMENYRMDKRIRTLAEKNRIHDELHKQTAQQINLMNHWLQQLEQSEDIGERRELLRRIVVVGAYLKRRNNLILICEQDGMIRAEELNLSFREMTKNLQAAGIECACSVELSGALPMSTAKKMVDFYEYVVEQAFDGLQSLLVRFFCREQCFYACIDAVCTLDLTQLQSEEISVSISEEHCYTISIKQEGGGRSE